MRLNGLDNFYVFPLEQVTYRHHPSNHVTNNARFKQAATPREVFWINRLRTWKPCGYNSVYSTRNAKRCRHAKFNPMAHRRQRTANSDTGVVQHKRVYAFRDWDRRVSFLLNAYQTRRFNRVQLDTYKPHTLRHMIAHLQTRIDQKLYTFGSLTYTLTNMTSVLTRLRDHAHNALHTPTPRTTKIEDPVPFRIQWHSQMLARIPLLRILKNAEGWPLAESHKDRLIVAKKLHTTIAQTICNYKAAAKTYEQHNNPDETCPCRMYNTKYRPSNGCVITMDMDIVPNTDLRALMREGANYREHVRIDYTQVIDEALARFSTYCQAALGTPAERFPAWEQRVREEVLRQLPPPMSNTNTLLRPNVRRCLKELKRSFVISITDKAAKNFTIVCKNHYKRTLQTELQTHGGAYTTVNMTATQIYEKYAHELATTKCPAQIRQSVQTAINKQEHHLPLLYWLPKMHKTVPKARFIAASFSVMTTPLARMINKVLKLVKDELKYRDEHTFRHTGVKRCWFINGFEEATRWLRVLNRSDDHTHRSLNTYDFATMYTTLNQESIVECLHFGLLEAFGSPNNAYSLPHHTYMHVKTGKAPAAWHTHGDMETPVHELYTVAELTTLVHILVTNTYIQNGTYIRRQAVGLPMGTNPAPHLADLTCYAYEARAMDTAMVMDIDAARRFIGTFRFIDDILSCDNPDFEQYVRIVDGATPTVTHPIYPAYLLLNRTTDAIDNVDFLGMNITSRPAHWHIKLADSKQRFPVPKINYPSLQGNFPGASGYGVYTGQLHRLARICTSAADFMTSTTQLAQTLMTKGYTYKRLMNTTASFLQTRNTYKTRASTILRTLGRMMR